MYLSKFLKRMDLIYMFILVQKSLKSMHTFVSHVLSMNFLKRVIHFCWKGRSTSQKERHREVSSIHYSLSKWQQWPELS